MPTKSGFYSRDRPQAVFSYARFIKAACFLTRTPLNHINQTLDFKKKVLCEGAPLKNTNANKMNRITSLE